jgi:drug/metabolite transporter (DMT)-like permease
VGLAYFLTAVVVPVGLMLARQQTFEWTARGVTFATLGGIAGAAGALCIILSIGALKGASPIFIAPLVFAGAPIVNVIVSLAWKTKEVPGPLFFLGIVLAAVGAGLVLYSKNELDDRLKQMKQPESHARLAVPAGGPEAVPLK